MLNTREIEAQMKAFANVVRNYFKDAIVPFANRIQTLEEKFSGLVIPSAALLVDEIKAAVFAELPVPTNGKDGVDGKNADPDLVKQLVLEAVSSMPVPKDGEPGRNGENGLAGKDADPEFIKQLVDEAAAKIPVPKDGEPGRDGKDGAAGKDGVDGKDVDPEFLNQLINEAVAKAFSGLVLPKDGEPGRDGAHIEILAEINPEKSYSRGTFAKHLGGLWRSFETTSEMRGWECIVDGIADIAFEKNGDRKFTLQVTRSSGASENKEIYLPAMVYRGVFEPGEYDQGDAVTWGGSLWHCDEKTSDKPGEVNSKGWTLCAKKGRDGKDGKDGKDLVKGVSIK